jgi:hypothetical protein
MLLEVTYIRITKYTSSQYLTMCRPIFKYVPDFIEAIKDKGL